MSDDQWDRGRDADASTDATRDQPPVPPYVGAYAGSGPYAHPGPPLATGPAWRAESASQPRPYPAAVAEKPRGQRAMTGIVAAALIAGLVGGGAGFAGAYVLLGDGGEPILVSAPAAAANTVPGSVADAAAKAGPSTVDIRVTIGQGTAEGSGVILTADGNVLTNNHVVADGGDDITVTLADGTERSATVVGTSPSYDIAVLKLTDASGLTPAVLGRSADVQVGQQVVAIGSPQGLTGTVTAGIISAFDRTVRVQAQDGSEVVYNGLQTDAPINQGNSGGPLVNLDGQVVGINSAIATGGGQNAGSIGLGFAIPVDQVERVSQEIMDTGSATKPLLGVEGNPDATNATGAQLSAIQPDSPAAVAGLVAGDVVTRVGDVKVEDFSDLIARIGANAPGAEVVLTLVDGRTVQVTLGSQPDRAATTDTGGESTDPSGGRSPFGTPPN